MKLSYIAPALAVVAAGCVQVGDPAALNTTRTDHNVTIVNETKASMTAFYGSNVDSETWEENILGDEQLKPGHSVTIDFKEDHGKCIYDFRGEFSDGGSYEQPAVNVCKVGVYKFTQTKN